MLNGQARSMKISPPLGCCNLLLTLAAAEYIWNDHTLSRVCLIVRK